MTILIFLHHVWPKRVFPVKNGKSEHHHWILHIRISLDTKFQRKLTDNFDILDQICQRRIFPVGSRKITIVRASMVFTYYETFPHGGRQTQQYFDVSSPSSGRDKNRDSHFWLIFEEKYFSCYILLTDQTALSDCL